MATFAIKQGDTWSHEFRVQRKLSPFEIWRSINGNEGRTLDEFRAARGLQETAAFVSTLNVSEQIEVWNLTGLTVTYQIRSGDSLAVEQPTVTVESATYGCVKIALTADQTANLSPGEYKGQLQIEGVETHSADPDTFTIVKDVNLA